MIGDDKKLEMAYKYCKLLKNECIKEELASYLESYRFKRIERESNNWRIWFDKPNGDYISLAISINKLSIVKYTDSEIERISVDNDMLLTDRGIDKRQNGIVYSVIEKQFSKSSRFNQVVLTDLVERRYTLTREKIASLLKNVDFDNIRLSSLFFKLRMLEIEIDLKSGSDFYSEFSTHMNYYLNLNGGRNFKNNIYPTKTYLNGEDVSNIFDIDGPDKLYRIYDLYNGVINPRNETDINAIHLGFLSQDVFNFKELKGITEQEDYLIGKPLTKVSDTYINYLLNFLDEKFGYKGKIGLDRNSILLGITYQMSGHERVKRKIERLLGIPYSEFEELDYLEQQKLIEQKIGKKIKYDNRLYIDGIPMDKEHIITIQQIDRQIDELTSSTPKKNLKQLLKQFNKK